MPYNSGFITSSGLIGHGFFLHRDKDHKFEIVKKAISVVLKFVPPNTCAVIKIDDACYQDERHCSAAYKEWAAKFQTVDIIFLKFYICFPNCVLRS